MNSYEMKAANTKARRRAAGKYAQPTKAQKIAFQKAMQSRRLYGEPELTKEDLIALSTHPYLLESQRNEFAQRAGL